MGLPSGAKVQGAYASLDGPPFGVGPSGVVPSKHVPVASRRREPALTVEWRAELPGGLAPEV